MSDNPDEIRVGIEADEEGFDSLVRNIKGIEDELTRLGSRGTVGLDALQTKFDNFKASLQTTSQSVTMVNQSYVESTRVAQNLDDTIVKLTKDTEEYNRVQVNIRQMEHYYGYGVEGGLQGPAQAPQAGSLYGAGRAFSAGGELLRNTGGAEAGDALAGVGQLIRFEEGLQQLGPYLRTVNEEIVNSNGLIPRLSQSLAAMNVPFAGVIVVAGLVTAAIAGVVVVFNAVKESLKPLNDALKEGVTRNTEYYKAVETGSTIPELQKKLAEGQDILAGSTKALADQQGGLDKKFNDLRGSTASEKPDDNFPLLRDLGSRIVFGLAGVVVPAIGDLNKSAEELKKTTEDTTAKQKAYNDALLNTQVLANTAAEKERENQDERIQREGQFRQFTQLSSDAAQDRINLLEEDRQSQYEAIQALEKLRPTLKEGSVAYLENEAAIDKHRKALGQDITDINDLTTAIINIIQPRERETAAINAQNEAIQRKIGFMGRETDLIETGSPEQLESYKRSLRNQLAAQQYEMGQIQGRGNDTTPEDQARIDSLKASIKDTVDELARLEQVIGPIVETNKALKDMAKAAEDFDKAAESIATNLQTQRANARAREAEAEKQYMAGSLQDIEARYQIALKADRAETELAQRTSDAIIDVLTKREQKIADINLDFARQVEDDTIKARDEAGKIQQDAQRQIRDDLADHLNRIAEINRNAFADEKQALYDRNFLQFAKLELQRQTDLADEDSKFQQKRDKVGERLRQDEEELVQSLENQAEQRQRDYERKLADADTAAQREIAQQNTNEQRKLAALRQSEADQINDLVHSQRYKIQILQQGLQQELQIYAAQASARIRLAAQERDAITAQAQNTMDIINMFTQQQRISNTTQAIYPWQTAPAYNSTTNNQFNPQFNVTNGTSRQYSEQDVSHEFERFASGVFR